MNKAKIPRPENIEARVGVFKRPISLFIKRYTRAREVGAHEERGRSSEKIRSLQKIESANVAAGHFRAGIGQLVQRDVISFQFVRANNSDFRVYLCNLHHTFDAFRKDAIVCLDDLAIFAIPRYAGKRVVIVLNLRKKGIRSNYPDFVGVNGSIAGRDFTRSVSTAIIDKRVFPIPVRLSQNAFYALRKIGTGVVERSNNADWWSRFHVIGLGNDVPIRLANAKTARCRVGVRAYFNSPG